MYITPALNSLKSEFGSPRTLIKEKHGGREEKSMNETRMEISCRKGKQDVSKLQLIAAAFIFIVTLHFF